MADDPAAVTDNPAGTPTATDGAPATGGNATGERVVFGGHEFASMEEADRAYRSSQAEMQAAQRERAELRKRVDDAERQDRLAEKLDLIAQNTAKPTGPTSWEQECARLVEEYGEEAAKPIIRMMEVNADWQRQRDADWEKRLGETTAAYEKRINELAATQEKADPGYQANKALVDKLVEGGMPFKSALAMAGELKATLGPEQPGAIQAPGGINGTRATASGADDNKPYFTPEDRADLKAAGVPEAQIDAMEAERKGGQ